MESRRERREFRPDYRNSLSVGGRERPALGGSGRAGQGGEVTQDTQVVALFDAGQFEKKRLGK